jgi:hypothetical protein
VLASAGGIRAARLVDDGEFEAVAEVDEALAVTIQVQIDPALLVVIVRLWRRVGVGEADAPGKS